MTGWQSAGKGERMDNRSAFKKQISLESYCLRNGREELLDQFDRAKNAPLTPDTVSAGTSRKLWWVDVYGHSWQQAVYNRTAKHCGCPICGGREVLPGFNDLATTHPDLAAEWDGEKNGTLTPRQVSAGNNKKAWWLCGKGHSWQASIASRAAGCGCPVCANRVILPGYNDLATTHPDLAAEWDMEKNAPLTPQQVSYGYDRKVWWLCEKGHSWQAAPKTRVRMGAGCPICANDVVLKGYNDLAAQYPLLAAQWHPTRNGNLKPDQVVSGSHRTVWWQCALGHEWRAAVVDRTRGTNGCPYCAGKKVLPGFNDLATVEPDIAAEWHPTLNGALTPRQVTSGSNRKVWWRCREGHVWRTSICNRTNAKKRTGCPVCAGNIDQRRQLRYQDMARQAAMEHERRPGG